MITITEYFKPFDQAIKQIDIAIGKLWHIMSEMSADDILLNPIDYDKAIKHLEDVKTLLKKKKFRFRFDKMSQTEFEQLLRQDSNGMLTVAQEYQVKQWDTLRSISLEFDVDILTLKTFNNLQKQDFNDLRERQGKILIPIQVKSKERTVYENLSVFDSHSGKSVWGKGLPNELIAKDGSLVVLNEEDNLKQSLFNLLNEEGAIPFYEHLTFDIKHGEDVSKLFFSAMTVIKLQNRLKLEPRVFEVIDIISQEQETGFAFTVYVRPINSFDTTIEVKKVA